MRVDMASPKCVARLCAKSYRPVKETWNPSAAQPGEPAALTAVDGFRIARALGA
jgi:hypothetical protein